MTIGPAIHIPEPTVGVFYSDRDEEADIPAGTYAVWMYEAEDGNTVWIYAGLDDPVGVPLEDVETVEADV